MYWVLEFDNVASFKSYFLFQSIQFQPIFHLFQTTKNVNFFSGLKLPQNAEKEALVNLVKLDRGKGKGEGEE